MGRVTGNTHVYIFFPYLVVQQGEASASYPGHRLVAPVLGGPGSHRTAVVHSAAGEGEAGAPQSWPAQYRCESPYNTQREIRKVTKS